MSAGAELERCLGEVFQRGVYEPLDDGDFNELALRIFRFQIDANQAYRGFVFKRGVDPDQVSMWEEFPFLPARAFKSAVLISGSKSEVERVFRTSGTTQGGGKRGEHHLLSLSLYGKSLLPNFRAHLLPDEPGPIRILCLLPDPRDVPDSSLASMMAEVISGAGDPGSGFFLRADGGLAAEAFHGALRRSEDEGATTLVAGTAFSLARWGELAEARAWKVRLPPGSRIMETGGYKGKSVELPREVLYGILQDRLGVPEERIVNEYGMTELLSQFYEPVLPGAPGAGGRWGHEGLPSLAERFHREPPWVRTLVLDPVTLGRVAPGNPGVLAHLDLANLWSVAAVLTEDRGRRVEGGFQLLGRSPGSEPRGCSLAMEDFLASREEGL
jgi:hypothetical protein